ncbi:MAG: C10 family peptidase [Promethearchaeota archaeon]
MKCNLFKKSRVSRVLILFLIISLLFFPLTFQAEEIRSISDYGLVSEEEAIAIADLWYTMELNSGYLDIAESERIERLSNLQNREVFYLVSGDKILDKTPEDGNVLAYIIRYEPSGFVVVAGTDRIQPIIAFDVKSAFVLATPEEDAMINFLCYSIPLRWENLCLEVHPNWINLRSKLHKMEETEDVFFDISEGSFYVHWETAEWSQGWPYNEVVASKNVISGDPPNYNIPTGCVATALAIKFRFHKWPIKGNNPNGHPYSYTDDAGVIRFTHTVDYDAHTYNWDNMPTINLNESNSQPSERLDVATLMYHCGVAVNMNYEERASSASHLTENIEKIFSYKATEYMSGFEALFDINIEFREDLNRSVDTGVISDELKQKFIDNGYPLSGSVVIRKQGKSRWIFIDSGNNIIYIFGIISDEKIRVHRLMESEMGDAVKASIVRGLPVYCGSISHAMIIEGYRDTLHPFFCVNHGDPWNPLNCGWIDLFLSDDGLTGAWIESIHPNCCPTNYIYVDPSWTGDKNGNPQTPFDTFTDGYYAVPDKGHLWLRTGGYNIAPITLRKPMTIHAYQGEGPVTLPYSKAKSEESLFRLNDQTPLPERPRFIKFLETLLEQFPLFQRILQL